MKTAEHPTGVQNMKTYIFLFNGQEVEVHAKSLNDARHIINSWKQPGDKIIPMGRKV